jgi:hypothetical protein
VPSGEQARSQVGTGELLEARMAANSSPGDSVGSVAESGGVGPAELSNELTFQARCSQTSVTICVRHDC